MSCSCSLGENVLWVQGNGDLAYIPLLLLRQIKGSMKNIRVLVHAGPGDEKWLCEEHHEPNCRTSLVQNQKTSEGHCPSTLPDEFPWHHLQFHQPFLHSLPSILPRKLSPKLNFYPSLFLGIVLTQMLLYKRTLRLVNLRHLSGVRVQMNRWDWVLIWSPGWPQTQWSSCPRLPARTVAVLLHACWRVMYKCKDFIHWRWIIR